jgi:hypothetical protein
MTMGSTTSRGPQILKYSSDSRVVDGGGRTEDVDGEQDLDLRCGRES